MTRASARRRGGKGRVALRPAQALLPLVQDAWNYRTEPRRPPAARARAAVLAPDDADGFDPTRGPFQFKLFKMPLRRLDAPKPRTLGKGPLTRAELAEKARLDARDARLKRLNLPLVQTPPTREGCRNIPRPCPFVGCAKNNYLTVTDNGTIKVTFPDLQPHQMDPDYSCSADVADRGEDLKTVNGTGGATVEEVAYAMNMTPERVRQIEVSAKRKVRNSDYGEEMADLEAHRDPTWRDPYLG